MCWFRSVVMLVYSIWVSQALILLGRCSLTLLLSWSNSFQRLRARQGLFGNIQLCAIWLNWRVFWCRGMETFNTFEWLSIMHRHSTICITGLIQIEKLKLLMYNITYRPLKWNGEISMKMSWRIRGMHNWLSEI